MPCADTSPPVLRCAGVDFAYGPAPALSGVTFTATEGAYVAVLGPNGGGKTTLVRLLLGLLAPDRGTIRVFGEPPGHRPDRIGYVPQQADVPPGMPVTAEQMVLLGLPRARRRRLVWQREDRQQATRALEQAGVAGLAHRAMDDLSGGERQRVLIARALVTDPRLLVFDEPTANVDPHGRSCFFELLGQMRANRTVLLVSHDLTVAAPPVTGILCVNRTALFNPAPELTPAMRELLFGHHDPGCPVGDLAARLTAQLPHAEDSRHP